MFKSNEYSLHSSLEWKSWRLESSRVESSQFNRWTKRGPWIDTRVYVVRFSKIHVLFANSNERESTIWFCLFNSMLNAWKCGQDVFGWLLRFRVWAEFCDEPIIGNSKLILVHRLWNMIWFGRLWWLTWIFLLGSMDITCYQEIRRRGSRSTFFGL